MQVRKVVKKTETAFVDDEETSQLLLHVAYFSFTIACTIAKPMSA